MQSSESTFRMCWQCGGDTGRQPRWSPVSSPVSQGYGFEEESGKNKSYIGAEDVVQTVEYIHPNLGLLSSGA